ncbi:MAG: tRNA (adenosine(37)-N6)-dimethylallyltransferase MiaA [Solirubrobacteraceae bacterium]|nr:tRNA (adenosine(37)-N6)-dimethylallyltransferase MiaA [Solirubrobacteraceae bacterium]
MRGVTGVLAIFGPTAVGKTAIAIAAARRIAAHGGRAVAVGADALQLYAGLEVLTAAPTPDERAELDHRLVGSVAVTEEFSVARYARLAHAEIDGLLAAGITPIVVGGTGLYLRAALADLQLRPPPEPGVREGLMRELDEFGPEALHARLAAAAPWAAERIGPRDRSRIVRSLELLAAGQLEPGPAENELWTAHTRHPTRLVGLVMDRDALVARIDARVDEMVDAGVVDEVHRADAAGASSTARAAVGFSEFLAGDIDGAKVRTRRLARRQLTWMRKLAGVELVDVTDRDADEVAAALDLDSLRG